MELGPAVVPFRRSGVLPSRLTTTLYKQPNWLGLHLVQLSPRQLPVQLSCSAAAVGDANGSLKEEEGRPPVVAVDYSHHKQQQLEEEDSSSILPALGRRSYPFHEIEPLWQRYWEEHRTFRTPDAVDLSKPKFYILDMFPYPR